jgi:hypothetical protein
VCAECRRVASSGAQPGCRSCAWSAARHHRDAVAGSPLTDNIGAERHSAHSIDADQLGTLYRLAALVGEDGAAVISRVLRGLAQGNSRTYRAELNRLTNRFLATLPRL